MKTNNPANMRNVSQERAMRLGRKRYSCRLPLELAAKLEALYQMYPGKTRTQLIGDLLGLGLAEVERAWSGSSAGQAGFHPDTRQPIYLLTGPFAEFRGLAHKHHLAMERELGEDPQVSYPVDAYTLGDGE